MRRGDAQIGHLRECRGNAGQHGQPYKQGMQFCFHGFVEGFWHQFSGMFQVIHNVVFLVNFHFHCVGRFAHREAMRDSGAKGANYFQESEAGGRRADTQTDSVIANRLSGADPNIAS